MAHEYAVVVEGRLRARPGCIDAGGVGPWRLTLKQCPSIELSELNCLTAEGGVSLGRGEAPIVLGATSVNAIL